MQWFLAVCYRNLSVFNRVTTEIVKALIEEEYAGISMIYKACLVEKYELDIINSKIPLSKTAECTKKSSN